MKGITIRGFSLMMVMVLFCGIFVTANACKKTGNPVKCYNADTKMVITGDSRIRYMHNYFDGSSASYVAYGGGHYKVPGKIYKSFNYINSNDMKDKCKTYIKNTLTKHGKCKVIVEGTINDVNAVADKKISKAQMVDAAVSYANELAGISVKYKGNDVKPKVYLTEIIRKKSNGKKDIVSYFNTKVKEKQKNNSYTYMALPNPSNSDFKDNLHFHKEFTRKMIHVMKDASY